MFAASGFYAPIWATNADDVVDQTAMAIPRIGMPGAPSVALPQPLTPGDVARVRRIFALQRGGAVSDATREMERLESDILRGAILADRYLNTAYIPDAPELSAWLARYGEQPDAPQIRSLLETLIPPVGSHPDHVALSVTRPKAGPIKKSASSIPPRTLLVQNNDSAAVDAALSFQGVTRAVPGAADALFAGGVAAWRLSDFDTAKSLFEAAWHGAETASSRAAAAFWIARLADRAHDRGGRIFWLRRAARETSTFYGPIARHALNPIVACSALISVSKPVVTNADVDALMATAPGRRSFALLQVGERRQAEAELRSLWFDSEPRPALGRSLVLVAKAVGLDRFADELREAAGAAEAAMGRSEPPLLLPAEGFRMDPAFVYAVVRHESNFQPLAVSAAGARGLMQIKPATAASISGVGDGRTVRLNDPSTNLAIGQRYLIQLSDNALVGDDLLKLIAAYGQGPAGMNHWAEKIRDNDDPFVFLEAIPSPFMRQFVEDVLTFQWQYAAALRLRATSLDELAAGLRPRFTPIKAGPGGMKTRLEVCPAALARG